jgi:hypothetical protein
MPALERVMAGRKETTQKVLAVLARDMPWLRSRSGVFSLGKRGQGKEGKVWLAFGREREEKLVWTSCVDFSLLTSSQ